MPGATAAPDTRSMTTITPTNGARRTGATWIAATGAFLLLAAATVFVWARWDSIPDAAKLGALVGLTGACVLIGDRLRGSLPATGNAVFHLGALLVPIAPAKLARVCSTIFGRPVVPEVSRIHSVGRRCWLA